MRRAKKMKETRKILDVAKDLNLNSNQLFCYGDRYAKITDLNLLKNTKKGKLILTTAITPTKAGEGKTTTAIGLADGLKAMQKNVIACLREPSLGPVFGVKGGGCGGGKATLYPEEDINLHFTGDLHAITSVNNLIVAMIDNEAFQHSDLNVDPNNIVFPRAMDMNDRSLRKIKVACGEKDGQEHPSSFVITAASEIMAIFCLAKDEEDFLNRVDDILVAYSYSGQKIHVKDLHIRESIRRLIHHALYPNLAQTLYSTPAIIHGGPFANIAHGTNSIIATNLSLKLADYVVTEAGFGSDLGMEKYLDIVSNLGQFHPDLIVLVCSARALKLHGGIKFAELEKTNVDAIQTGLANLDKHLENISFYKLPVLVSINRFASDSDEEIEIIENHLNSKGIPYSLNTSYLDGPEGAIDLAKKVISITDTQSSNDFKTIVNMSDSLIDKINTISSKIYGAESVIYDEEVMSKLNELNTTEAKNYFICMSKTPNSLSDDPKLLNVPKHVLHVRKLRIFEGAKFIVPLTGDVMTMPGLPKIPQGKKI